MVKGASADLQIAADALRDQGGKRHSALFKCGRQPPRDLIQRHHLRQPLEQPVEIFQRTLSAGLRLLEAGTPDLVQIRAAPLPVLKKRRYYDARDRGPLVVFEHDLPSLRSRMGEEGEPAEAWRAQRDQSRFIQGVGDRQGMIVPGKANGRVVHRPTACSYEPLRLRGFAR